MLIKRKVRPINPVLKYPPAHNIWIYFQIHVFILFIFVNVDLCKLTLFLQIYVNLVLIHHLCYNRCWKNLMHNWVSKNIMFGHCIKTLRQTRSQPKSQIPLFLLEERNWLMNYTMCIKKLWMEERKECWSYWKKWT